MITKTASFEESFRRSIAREWNDGTIDNAERVAERQSLKAIAREALQRNAARNDSGTALKMEHHRSGIVPPVLRHRIEIWGEYTPYCHALPLKIVAEMHELIRLCAIRFALSEEATERVIAAAKGQSLSSVPETIQSLRRQLSS